MVSTVHSAPAVYSYISYRGFYSYLPWWFFTSLCILSFPEAPKSLKIEELKIHQECMFTCSAQLLVSSTCPISQWIHLLSFFPTVLIWADFQYSLATFPHGTTAGQMLRLLESLIATFREGAAILNQTGSLPMLEEEKVAISLSSVALKIISAQSKPLEKKRRPP